MAHPFILFGQAIEKKDLYNKITTVFGKDAFPRLLIMEEKFYSAHLCCLQLKNRSEEYNQVLTHERPEKIIANDAVRRLHSYEYFFFMCCGDIYHEIELFNKNQILLDIPKGLVQDLRKLRVERSMHEHGKQMYWHVAKGGKISPQDAIRKSNKGDNYDFDRNMHLLEKIYEFITCKVLD